MNREFEENANASQRPLVDNRNQRLIERELEFMNNKDASGRLINDISSRLNPVTLTGLPTMDLSKVVG